ncbi:hypothetical protein AWJ20_3912 [Sugiyamaella lignohabitans]|uniref:Uncharacterized protein n=1 Tax=Sugiyamaella lignohabitans TaxID=796027 RepID=A0A167C1U6_9ASCO|nr:uncharacterized protein AWJ20_3912 [Sugiyamaella lignohabitans]ANB11114.1 hypothetical protein AWJ20_3912 [Sugiyamaella lignohabitans]
MNNGSERRLVKVERDGASSESHPASDSPAGELIEFKKWPQVESSEGGKMRLVVQQAESESITTNQTDGYRLKRPEKVIAEDEYSESLSNIISRDYFGGMPPDTSVTPSVSLDEYQAKYTSEDNDSFNSLLEAQIQEQREKFSWLWKSNKLDSGHVESTKRIMDKQQARFITDRAFTESERATENLGLTDRRPTRLRSNVAKDAKNALMFAPEVIGEKNNKRPAHEVKPKKISRENTRLDISHNAKSSHNLPAVHSAVDVITPPTVNSYGFVTENTYSYEPPAQSRRDNIHDRILKNEAEKKRQKKEESIFSFNSRSGRITKTPVSSRGASGSQVSGTPLSPAAARLMGRVKSTKMSGFDFTPKRK